MELRYDYPYTAAAAPQKFTGDPDLIFLREDLTDELGAIIGYLQCADEVRDYEISRQFQHIASEEEGHFSQLLKIISVLDPVQGEEFRKRELSLLPVGEPTCSFGGVCKNCGDHEQESPNSRKSSHDKKHYIYDERTIECLQNAIKDEIRAINAYQKQIQATGNPSIQSLLVTIMNKEKEHLAIFTKIYFSKSKILPD